MRASFQLSGRRVPVAIFRACLIAVAAAAVGGCGDDSESVVSTEPVFDLVGQDREHLPYRAEVDLIDMVDFRVEPPAPRPLYVNHSVEVHVAMDVEAEPFQTDVTYGLQDAAGNFCVIGHLEADHLPEMFDAAHLANENIAAHSPDVGQPSLEACSPGSACAAVGEECLGFSDFGADGQPEVSYVCTTTTWAAAAVYAAQDLAVQIEPGDLTGSVRRSYDFVHADVIPESCSHLVGTEGLSAWLTFDAFNSTDVVGRAELPAPEGSGPPATFDEGTGDSHALELVDAARAYALRDATIFTVSTPLGADPGPDLQIEHLRLGSAIVPIHDRPTGDGNGSPPEIDATVIFDIEGAPTSEQAAQLAAAGTTLRFELEPTGEPIEGCLAAEADIDALRTPVALTVVHGHDDGSVDTTSDEPIAAGIGEQHSHTVALEIPTETRQSILHGDLACWGDFHVRACATTSGPQAVGAGIGTEDDCVVEVLQFDVETFAAPEDGEELTDEFMEETINAETDPEAMLDDAVEFSTPGTCSQGLIAEYQRLRTLYEESLITSRVTQYYTTDWEAYVTGVTFSDGWYHCGQSRYGRLVTHPGHNWRSMVQAVADCSTSYAATGNLNASSCWAYPGGNPGGCFGGDYWNIVRPYFVPGPFDSFRHDPAAFTDGYFNYACQGLISGAACPTDMAAVPGFANDIRTLAELVAAIKARGGTIDELPSNWRTFADRLGGTGGNRCARVGLSMLQRAVVDEHGVPLPMSEDGAFYNDFVPEICQRADYRRRADAVWAEIARTCTEVSKPFNRDGYSIYSGSFSDAVYRGFSVEALSIRGVIEGGMVNRWYVDRWGQQLEAVIGPQARIYVEGEGDLDFIRIHDIFRVWALVHLYNNVFSSYAEFGLHALTHDLWRTEFRFPDAEWVLPSPPPLSKEAERCRYFYKPPIPARLHLCGGVGGEVGMGLNLRVRRPGVQGDLSNSDTWPEIQGAATPYLSISTFASAAIDIFFLEAGGKLTLDPTVAVELPVQAGVRFDMYLYNNFGGLNINFWPYFRAAVEVHAFGGQVELFAKSSILGLDSSFVIYDWDPIELWGRELFLFDHRIFWPIYW